MVGTSLYLCKSVCAVFAQSTKKGAKLYVCAVFMHFVFFGGIFYSITFGLIQSQAPSRCFHKISTGRHEILLRCRSYCSGNCPSLHWAYKGRTTKMRLCVGVDVTIKLRWQSGRGWHQASGYWWQMAVTFDGGVGNGCQQDNRRCALDGHVNKIWQGGGEAMATVVTGSYGGDGRLWRKRKEQWQQSQVILLCLS